MMADYVENLKAENVALRADQERMREALQQLADNDLGGHNCASAEVAGRRVANIARAALSTPRQP